MGEVISLNKYREAKKTKHIREARVKAAELNSTTPDELATRLTRIKESIGRINKLMSELREMHNEDVLNIRKVDR